MPRILAAFFIFLFLATFSSVYAQSSDCRQEFSDQKSFCVQSGEICNKCSSPADSACSQACNQATDKCTQAVNTFQACLGAGKESWKLQTEQSGHISCDEWKKFIIIGSAENCKHPAWVENKLWCTTSDEQFKSSIFTKRPADYILDFDPNSCIPIDDDLKSLKVELSSTSGSSSEVSRKKINTIPVSVNSSSGKGNPFNIFGVNPYQTWLNLQELVQAGAFMKTGALDKFTESTILHSVGVEPYWEKDAREAEAINKFYDQATERLLKLKGKTGWTEINDTTKKVLIEAANEPVTLKKDSATIDLQPQAGKKGVLETGSKPLLKSGAVDVIVEPKTGKDFEMQTPNMEIMVIGTEFSVIYDQKENKTLLAVYKGKVEVITKDGQTSIVTPDGSKPGVVVVSQKLSVVKLVIVGAVLAAIASVVVFFLKRKFSPKRIGKKK